MSSTYVTTQWKGKLLGSKKHNTYKNNNTQHFTVPYPKSVASAYLPLNEKPSHFLITNYKHLYTIWFNYWWIPKYCTMLDLWFSQLVKKKPEEALLWKKCSLKNILKKFGNSRFSIQNIAKKKFLFSLYLFITIFCQNRIFSLNKFNFLFS